MQMKWLCTWCPAGLGRSYSSVAFDNGLIAPNNDNYAKLQELQDKYEQLESDNFALSRSRDDLKKLNQRLSEQNVQLEKELKELQAEFDKSREKKPI